MARPIFPGPAGQLVFTREYFDMEILTGELLINGMRGIYGLVIKYQNFQRRIILLHESFQTSDKIRSFLLIPRLQFRNLLFRKLLPRILVRCDYPEKLELFDS